ncbi:MAG TPA: DUF5700 domain-containing putative Zn-dependent protease [Thermoanaerobaculia bacterium]|nr:DUF5700 domain-containing putative Zn-dependent protease [Thermoanaerobaculia bacterium]
MRADRLRLVLTLLLPAVCAASLAAEPVPAPVEVRLVTDEAEAVLAILDKRRALQEVPEADWRRLFASEGYVRLKAREAAMGVPFEDAAFRDFVLSADLASRAGALAETLAKWRRGDPAAAARRALDYLPAGARIRAKVYPVIKPKANSFVFDVKTDPAIFLFLDPAVTPERFENTLAHELHHIGYGGVCPPPPVAAEIERLPEPVQTVLGWTGAFGEGIAMLAAAGGPDVHPHAVSEAKDRERWDRDVARFAEDFRKVDRFFADVLAGRLGEEEATKVALSFYGEQGPWYTVGWKMATTIEKTFGRERLLESACDPRSFLKTYGEAARKAGGGGWSAEVLRALSVPSV